MCGTVRTTHVTGAVRSDYDGKRRWLVYFLYQWTDGRTRLCIGHLRRYKGNTAGERKWDDPSGVPPEWLERPGAPGAGPRGGRSGGNSRRREGAGR